MPLQLSIVAELSEALEKIDAPPKLRAIVGSWGDTLGEEEILELLKEWNETGDIRFDPMPPPAH